MLGLVDCLLLLLMKMGGRIFCLAEFELMTLSSKWHAEFIHASSETLLAANTKDENINQVSPQALKNVCAASYVISTMTTMLCLTLHASHKIISTVIVDFFRTELHAHVNGR